MLNRFYFWVGIALLIYFPVIIAWNIYDAPGHWQWGPHGIPIPLQGDLPGQYPDGTQMNIPDTLILQSGHPELIYGLLISTVLFAVGWFVVVVRQTSKLRREAEFMMESFEKLLRAKHPAKADQVKTQMQSTIRRLTWFPRQPTDKA